MYLPPFNKHTVFMVYLWYMLVHLKIMIVINNHYSSRNLNMIIETILHTFCSDIYCCHLQVIVE